VSPQSRARRIVERYETREPFRLAELMDVAVIDVSLGKGVNGLVVRDNGWFYVGLQAGLSAPYRRMALAHELGHIVCHPGLNCLFLRKHTFFPVGRYEREANEFAAELLIPDEVFCLGGDMRILASRLEVPVALFKFKKMPPGIKL
jgi:Zn-dependent peptidase ImmA (M78 family)